jgi:phosphomannomutase
MPEKTPVFTEYHCPGQSRPISRAVHLGRMAAYYPGCRTCPHQEDTGTLSLRQIKRLKELRARVPQDPWSEDGVTADSINQLPPPIVRKIGAAFSAWLAQQDLASIQHSAFSIQHSAVLAGDARAETAEAFAALSEGLRWADVAVIDIGSATAASTAFAVRRLQACGGVQIGNPRAKPHGVGIRFWGPEAAPLFTPEQLIILKESYERGVDRPSRSAAACRRVSMAGDYRAALAGLCHALRPLRLVAASTSMPWLSDLQQLLETTACEILPCDRFVRELPEQIRAERAHFGIQVFDDGERCRVFDQQGAELPWERLLQVLLPPAPADRDSGTLILEEESPEAAEHDWESRGGTVIRSPARRAAMAAAMQAHSAVLGAGPTGRFWYLIDDAALPDALATLLLLMQRLSRDDRPLSVI